MFYFLDANTAASFRRFDKYRQVHASCLLFFQKSSKAVAAWEDRQMMAEQMLIKGIFITAQICGGQGRYHRGHAYVGKQFPMGGNQCQLVFL